MPRPAPSIACLLLLALLGLGGAVSAQMESGDRGILPLDSSGTLEIGGIHVEVGGTDATVARFAGWRIAQREGFKALWSKMRGRPPSEAPSLPDSTLDSLVSSIIIEREQIGPDRYVADLGILFDRVRAGQLLGDAGEARRSAPMLLIPIITTGGTATTLETRNPWQRAWAQFRTSSSPIDYVRLSGLGIDPLLVNAAQARRPGRGWWRTLIDLYDAADILVAEVQLHRLYPGGPALGRFIARHGPDGEILGGFTLQARDSAALPAMLAQGVERIDTIFTQAHAFGRLERDPTLITELPPLPIEEEIVADEVDQAEARTYQVEFDTPDGAAIGAAIGVLRSIGGVTSVNERSIAVGGISSLLVAYRGDLATLRAGLIARGWSAEPVGGALRIRYGGLAAPPPPPAPPAPGPAPAPASPSQ